MVLEEVVGVVNEENDGEVDDDDDDDDDDAKERVCFMIYGDPFDHGSVGCCSYNPSKPRSSTTTSPDTTQVRGVLPVPVSMSISFSL